MLRSLEDDEAVDVEETYLPLLVPLTVVVAAPPPVSPYDDDETDLQNSSKMYIRIYKNIARSCDVSRRTGPAAKGCSPTLSAIA